MDSNYFYVYGPGGGALREIGHGRESEGFFCQSFGFFKRAYS